MMISRPVKNCGNGSVLVRSVAWFMNGAVHLDRERALQPLRIIILSVGPLTVSIWRK